MYGRPPHFRHGGGGAPPPLPHPQQPPFQQPPPGQQFPFHNYLQNPNNLLYQSPNLLFFNNLLNNINNVPIQPQDPNFHFQNVNFQSQNPNAQLPRFPQPRPQRPQESKPQPQAQAKAMPMKVNINEVLERLDRAVIKARHDILASGGYVSAWKVSQDALLALKAESWESLGFQMQQVPSLHRLMSIEAKINSFIHCYVGVRKVTTLYDLELAICKNEGVGLFEELELGPLVRHPLVVHYFSVIPDVKEVFRITSEDIISYLHEYLKTHQGKEVKVEALLDFIAEKQSKTSREKLNVRIQSLGWHITLIRKAVQSENATLKEHVDELRNKYGIRIRKRPLLSSKKGVLDDRFNEISQRMKSISSMEKIFCGKHVRFSSSSSDNDSTDDDEEDNEDKNDNYTEFEDNLHLKNVKSDANFTSPTLENSERVSRCPYPSASEEMARLGLKPDLECSIGDDTEDETNSMKNVPLTRKRKFSKGSSSTLLPRKLTKREKDKSNFHTGDERKKSGSKDTSDSSLVNDSTRMFITTWKETCQNNSPDEVLDRMLHMYSSRKKKKMLTALFSSYPFAGLLDVAVKSIKCGMWDSIYDTFQTLGHQGALNSVSEKQVDCISIEVESDEEDAPISAGKSSKHECGVTVDDIIKKISSYFDFDGDVSGYANPTKQMRLSILRKLYKCESWLVEQLSVEEFECFGFGDFIMFLERYLHLLPDAMQNFLIGHKYENLPFEPCMLQLQLDVLMSQASNSIWKNEKVSKIMVSGLLSAQFPSVCFKSVENGSFLDLGDILRENEGNVTAKCVLFSATLLKRHSIGGSSALNENLLDSGGSQLDIGHNAGSLGLVTTKDAIEFLLRAPMLTDLHIWTHWDTNYAPSLGSLVTWLLKEVNARELLCLVSKGGKVMRLDHTATIESFLDVLLEGSCFGTAVTLLSLLALYGGEGNVPLSLLKCHAQKAFEVIINNSMGKEFHGDQGCLVQGESMPGHDVFEQRTSRNLGDELHRDRNRVNEVVQVISGLILDCLGYLPAEFWSFAATVLFAGLHNLVKDAPSAILTACKNVEQRVMLHEVGLSLGILEWIDDYHQFSSSALTNSMCTLDSSCSKDASYECNRGTLFLRSRLKDCLPSLGGMEVPIKSDQNNDHQEVNSIEQVADVSVQLSPDDTAPRLCKLDCIHDPLGVIDSIRRDEFGLDPSLSTTESRMLMKQHARLGRALHCLSHELYSQDSHFLLELVQNADDNIYPENVEPSLTFIVQEKGIVVLNNEMGFSAENVRALCDVGNSTKRGCSTGYIGKKGIGFKSVFRVTDAPEIHSNGFHIKFDITEGQIGFVLPTVVPPCDIESYSRLLSTNTDDMDCNSWRTCIVLPFKATLSQGLAMNIISMFSDLHPSLLLFLHRLQCIKLRNMLDNSLTVMRKEVTGDGIVKVSMGKEKMVWLVASQKLQADNIRHDVNETEISIAFSLEEANDGEYIPQLHQQPVFSFLPLRTYGLKFIVQGDFVLPSSREEVDGDSPWNQWLLSEIPELFVTAQKSFCDLSCFRENAAKAVTAFMSFVPFVGEVQGFFSSLPRLIISKLRMSNCLLLEADKIEWVPPCKVLRNWNEQARVLLPNWLLHKHLGLGFLKKDIILSDSLARALGIEEYGPKTVFHVMSSLSRSKNGLKDMGLGWLSSWINEVYLMSLNSGTESDLILSLRKVPFIPLSDGKYCFVDRGTIWLHCDTIGVGNEYDFKAFPKLYSKLRIVNPALFSAAVAADKSCLDASIVENVTRLLIKVGVQRLSAHEIVKMHILPSISDDRNISRDKDLLTDYLAFILLHMQSSCPSCCLERDWIMSHLRTEALVLTNYGYKRLNEVPIHFSRQFRNPIDMNKLINGIDMIWHELDSIYLEHPITKSVPDGILKWRNFFQELGITDFVQIVQVEKPIANVTLTSMGPTVKDWESWELGHLLSRFSSRGDREKCKYLLEIIDTLWDDYFSDKVTSCCMVTSCEAGKPFESSIISMLQNAKWMVSIMDDDLHYPRDLFLDCEAVRSIIGATAPYAVPKVRSQKLLDTLRLKSQVRIDDIMSLLKVWRTAAPFKTSKAQMSRLYTFIWGEMAKSKPKIVEELSSGPFIFFPHVSGFSLEDVVTGVFLSPKEVCWHDTTGSMDQMKLVHPKFALDVISLPCIKMLSRVYPALHDFFVNECGVEELPPINGYLQILIELSTVALPSQVARTVFNVFSEWADRLSCGLLSNEDVEYLRGRFLEKECAVFPTAQDKWVSLHPSFGLICWSDDDELRKEFKYLDGIDVLSFGNLMDEETELLQTKVANLMRMLGIPALSAVVSREAIYYGPTDSSLKASLINWVLPYAQRYIYYVHPDKYLQLKNCGFENLRCLQIVVVEKLFYRNVVKRHEVVSKKRFECTCLLQDNILYATPESDSHSIFMELSRVLFEDVPQLHLANFLHMITTMAEAGSSEEQTEFFILNSQKVPKLPEGETIWSLSSLSGIVNDELHTSSTVSALVDKSNTHTNKRKLDINSNWPPVGWKTAPSFNFACTNALKTQAGDSLPIREVEDAEEITIQTGQMALANLNSDLAFQGGQSSILPAVNLQFQDGPSSTTPEVCLQFQDGPSSTAPEACIQNQDAPSGTTPGACLQNTVIPEDQSDHASIMAACSSAKIFDSVDAANAADGSHFAFSDTGLRNQLSWGNAGAQAALTGKLGEFVAFKYFATRVGERSVKWVNEASETGLPYDLLVGNEENGWEYVEVKATKSRSATRDLAFISVREWQFAFEKGESFSIAHVILLDDNTARVTTYKNPVKLCQLGKLRLAVFMPRQPELSNLY